MKRLLCILLCLVLALGLFGCGDEAAYIPTGDALVYEEDYTGPTATRPQDTTEQTLTLTYYPDKPLNPLECADFTNRTLFSLVYQSLFTVDREYNVEPQLCKTFRRSEDMKTYTFYLEEARFSDGSNLTAADVSASLNAAMGSSVYSGRFRHVDSIYPNEDSSVTVVMDMPFENLPILLNVPILKESQVAAEYPLGTGPYVLDLSSQAGVLRRTENWWCKAELLVKAPAIKLTTAASPTDIRDQFEFFDLNVVCADPGSDRYADYRCDYELWDSENHIFLYLSVNMESEVFSNPDIRAALPLAIDRDTIAADFYRGFAYAANLPASPQSPYYSDVLAAKYAYDGGTAFAQAVGDSALSGKAVRLLVNKDDSLRLRVARVIGDALKGYGLAVEMVELGSSAYTKALQRKEYDLYLGQTKLSANMDLTPFFSNKGSLNYGGIGDVGFYTLCTEAFANYGNYYTLHQKVMNDGRLVPILFRSYAVYATRGLLTGLTPAPDNVFYYSMGKTLEQAMEG